MERKEITRNIKRITFVWMLLAPALAGAYFAGLLTKPQFATIFAGGFVLYAIVATILTRLLYAEIDKDSGQ